jgi:hypothetical protein
LPLRARRRQGRRLPVRPKRISLNQPSFPLQEPKRYQFAMRWKRRKLTPLLQHLWQLPCLIAALAAQCKDAVAIEASPSKCCRRSRRATRHLLIPAHRASVVTSSGSQPRVYRRPARTSLSGMMLRCPSRPAVLSGGQRSGPGHVVPRGSCSFTTEFSSKLLELVGKLMANLVDFRLDLVLQLKIAGHRAPAMISSGSTVTTQQHPGLWSSAQTICGGRSCVWLCRGTGTSVPAGSAAPRGGNAGRQD